MKKVYLAEFRRGRGAMGMSAIDFYKENGKIIKHHWAMGGEMKRVVKFVPIKIEGYINQMEYK